MQVTVVGSGDAFNASGRLHSCYLIEGTRLKPTMVDFGATALAGLHQIGRKACNIETFTFTHLHGDHIGGIPFLIIDSTFSDVRSTPLRFVGPIGLEKTIRALLELTYGLEFLKYPTAPQLIFEEIQPGHTRLLNGMALKTFPAAHMDPPHQPLCLRFEASTGESIAFSGDTEMAEGLRNAAHQVDLLIAECSALAPPAGRHCTWEDWKQELPTMTAKRVVLTHLGRAVREASTKLLANAPPGPRLDFADDGMVLEVLPRDVVPK